MFYYILAHENNIANMKHIYIDIVFSNNATIVEAEFYNR